MTPADLAALREGLQRGLKEQFPTLGDWMTFEDALSLLSTLEAEQQQRARLEQENERLREALRIAQPEFCSLKCPSVFTDASAPRHLQECVDMRAALSGDAP